MSRRVANKTSPRSKRWSRSVPKLTKYTDAKFLAERKIRRITGSKGI